MKRGFKHRSAIGIFLALTGTGAGLRAATQATVAPAGLHFEVEFTTSIGTATSHPNDKVEVRLLSPAVFAGHQVLPSGTVLSGRVLIAKPTNALPVLKRREGELCTTVEDPTTAVPTLKPRLDNLCATAEIMPGDPTPGLPALKLEFDKLTLPGGRTFPVSASLLSLKRPALHNVQEIGIKEDGLIEPKDPDLRAQEYLEGANSGGSPGSWGGAIFGGLAKGASAAALAEHQREDFTLKKGQKASMMLDSDLVLAGDGQSNSPPARARPETGTVSENLYRNEFFGFRYPFPQAWHVQGLEAQKQVMLRGHEIAFGENPVRPSSESGKEHLLAMERTRFLFGATQAPGNEMTIPSVQIIAIQLPEAEAVSDPKSLLMSLSEGMTSKGAVLMHPVSETRIAKRKFALAEYKMPANAPNHTAQTWFEGMALTYDRSYALLWFLNVNDELRLKGMLDSLSETSFSGGFQDEGVFLVYGKPRNAFSSWWPGLSKLLATKYTDLLSTVSFKAAADGSYESQISCGKNRTSATTILSDGEEGWKSITVTSSQPDSPAQNRVELIRQGSKVNLTRSDSQGAKATNLLFATQDQHPVQTDWSDECSSNPALLSPFLRLYDPSRGGKQLFKAFDFGWLALSSFKNSAEFLSLEGRGSTQRRFENQDLHLNWYSSLFAYPLGFDISVLADDQARIIMGRVRVNRAGDFPDPDDPSAKIFVRKGYESLLNDPYLQSLLAAP